MSGCTEPVKAKDLCNTHYQYKRRKGEVGTGKLCSFNGCINVINANGYCAAHYVQLRKTGVTKPIRVRSIHDHCSSASAHERIYKIWGAAFRYPCINCGVPAQNWAYDGTDPTQLYSKRTNQHYSRYVEFYMPLCLSCHTGTDNRKRSVELKQYRKLRHEFQLSYQEIYTLCKKFGWRVRTPEIR